MLVANSKEGATLIRSIAEYPTDTVLPILSHWGITGGDFHKKVPYSIRSKVNLRFAQTKFNFNQLENNPQGEELLRQLIQDYDHIKGSRDIIAGTGTSHAYDLTSIFMIALSMLDLSKKPADLRRSLKKQLENLDLNFKVIS